MTVLGTDWSFRKFEDGIVGGNDSGWRGGLGRRESCEFRLQEGKGVV